MIMNGKVKCELDYKQKENNDGDNNDDIKECTWTGELNALSKHVEEKCPLYIVSCEHCDEDKKRYEMEDHDKICPEKPLPCDLKCG